MKALPEVLAPADSAPPSFTDRVSSWSAERFSYGTPRPVRGPVVRVIPDRIGWRRHALAMLPVLLAAIWITRHFLFSSALPAGSDMFGFVARARENSGWAHLVSVWAPSYYGAPRQFTLDLVLGLVNHLTGNPVATVKLLVFSTLFAAGAFTYLLAYRWYGSTWVASVAGLLYMTSQQSLSRWGTGQLNHEIGFALAPLLIYLLARCVDEFTVARAIGVALAVNAELLVRPDVILWIAPFLALYPVIRAVVRKEGRPVAATVGRLCLIVVPATVALNMMQILPLLAGIRASWVSLGGLYGTKDLIDRSLDAYPSLLGFGREIGYIGFTRQQTWYFHPWVPMWAYFGAATALVALAFAALWRHRDHRTIFLATSAVTAGFLAKSVRGPVGGPYQWALDHLPLVPNLRDPNRWLIFQALAYAVLASLTLRLIADRLRARWKDRRLRFRASLALLFAVILLPVGPTLLTGLSTWRPEPGQIALLKTVEADPGTFTVGTVPFDQTGRFLVQGDYRGWEHDLGGDSAAFTGHPAISDGGWSQRSQDFVAFSSWLLKNHDPAFQEILGASGTKYLVKLAYPPTQPHLVRRGIAPFWQQEAIDSIPGFLPVATNDQGTVYRLASWSPLASIRPNLALIMGGPSGIAALADLPGIDLQNWAVITASDAISIGGLPELTRLISDSDLVVVSNETVHDFAVLASDPLLQIRGITSDPGFDRVGQQLGSDASARQGTLADQAVPVAASQTFSAQGSFTVGEPRDLEVWTRIKSFPNASRVAFAIDGRAARTLTPVSPTEAGLRWIQVYRGVFGPGTHRIAIQALPSQFGRAFELDETRVIDSAGRRSAEQELETGLGNIANKLAYAFDLQDVQKWNDSFDPFASRVPVDEFMGSSRRLGRFWQVLDPAHVVSLTGSTSEDGPMLSLRLHPGRTYYALVAHRFSAPQDWSEYPSVFLTVDGSGSGQSYEFVVDFGTGQATWSFRDDRSGPRTLQFTQSIAQSRIPIDWAHVVSVKLSTRSKDTTATFGVGAVEISGPAALRLSLPIVSSAEGRSAVVEETRDGVREDTAFGPIDVEPGAGEVVLTVPSKPPAGRRLIILPPRAVEEVPARPVRVEGTAVTGYRLEFRASGPGVLMFEQAYDSKWRAQLGSSEGPPVPLFSLMNGYLLKPGLGGTSEDAVSRGSITYTGQRVALLGLSLSALSWLGLGFLAMPFVWLLWRRRKANPFVGFSGSPSRVGLAAVVAIVLAVGGAASVHAWAQMQQPSVGYYWPQALATDPLQFWTTPDQSVQLGQVGGPDRKPAILARTVRPRSFFTLVEHTFTQAQDWSARRDAFIAVRGDGSGKRYQFVVYTNDRHEDSISFTFEDVQPGWRVLSLDLRSPTHVVGRPDLGHVTSLRIGTADRTAPGSLALASFTVSQPEP